MLTRRPARRLLVSLLLAAIIATLLAPGGASAQTSLGTDRLSNRTGTVTLQPGQEINDPSGRCRFVMQTDGNVVVYDGIKPKWNLGTTGERGARLVFQTDGNIVLYSTTDRVIWHLGSTGEHNPTLIMQDDCNAVVYSGNRVLWHSTPAEPALTCDRVTIIQRGIVGTIEFARHDIEVRTCQNGKLMAEPVIINESSRPVGLLGTIDSVWHTPALVVPVGNWYEVRGTVNDSVCATVKGVFEACSDDQSFIALPIDGSGARDDKIRQWGDWTHYDVLVARGKG